MSDFEVGERVAEVPYYNWKLHVKGVPLAEIPDVRYGEIVKKYMKSMTWGSYPRYIVLFGVRREDCDGVNLVSVENVA